MNGITVVGVLKFLLPTTDSFEVIELNSYLGEDYYYTEDIEKIKYLNEIIAFFESKKNLIVDTFSIKIDGVLIDIDDDYALNTFCEDHTGIEVFTRSFCSGFLNYNNELIEKILHLDGQYAMIDLGIIIKKFLTFDDYLEEIK